MTDSAGIRRFGADEIRPADRMSDHLFRYVPSLEGNHRLSGRGFIHLSPEELTAVIGTGMNESALQNLRASWDRLPADTYMNDGGRYRMRRHAVLSACRGEVKRLAYQPHFQSRAYNRLNGGVQRHYAEVEPEIVSNPLMQACVRLALDSAEPASGEDGWFIELHQFRILARDGQEGLPTPEGLHRDGVERVLMVLIRRDNVGGGVSRICAENGRLLEEICLAQPLEAMLVDDAAVRHAVTPVRAVDAKRVGVRDMLAITVRRSTASRAVYPPFEEDRTR